ncbi:hormonally up-regulated neu tumor-associated kinase [Dunckerocampus dactyliophorus]|uniref:hormonally up-regulated neu tumor-associated kinase n=1 Tax=Dunckerocampus dactyliophorus TaxID=161453 RepID=UPI002405309F|nr:hormonally up-regulated neu tumor-associated kinase [Dunckerocampus dactyliophorus]XP_054616973.1 hormonally up-regulated neu tumor-associated kinase [Dunckerocampus dactyliophorus]XP_054616974.1 hormonally up-regulated neu tumor-associated kinase [Dunckerocampus dactyliophorus]XP_054616975.1 hormonally up-regulated neu tumor-associated kinase [Dunckerocampus dactyliophorus]XP_054616976.1 hormonally up-regulated neu tumor-associated kinase [Dunckerocampus dactyliophorus]
MPAAAVKPSLAGKKTTEDEKGGGASLPGRVPLLAPPRELLQCFPHSKRVGSYLVGKMINKGSFAKVMEGLHLGTGEKVAIKVIDKKKARQDAYVQKNMKREPHVHQMIRHPHIVVLLETLETENSFYMVMEMCAGGDLMDRICERKRLQEREVRRYARQILSAVEHLHKHGIVHRDLKIENFLLDEHNNIKIVDFGLSNTLKAESLSSELLTTQCGSPAYAAPELLAHRKYGPKVDVWSIGVSMFAMLTGTLPFTVEPFNIKHLHHKMVTGDINSIPDDVSTGAATFVMSLLEPDPEKRPSVRAAMQARWINEGYAKRLRNALSHNNRLREEDLDASVLAYMTDELGYSRSETTHTLTTNRPSAIMASYHLLLAKQKRSLAGVKIHQSDSSKPPIRRPKARQVAESRRVRTRPERPHDEDEREDDDNRRPSPSLPPLLCAASREATDEETAAILVTREALLPDDKEVIHLSPPKTSVSHLCDSAPLPAEPFGDSGTSGAVQQTQHLRTTYSDGGGGHHAAQGLLRLNTLEKSGAPPRMHLDDHARRAPPTTLPRLRHQGLKEGHGRKVVWVSGSTGLQVNGSKTLPSERHPLVVRGQRGEPAGRTAATVGSKRNSGQLRSTPRRRVTDVNLPLLPAALQRKTDRKLHSVNY